jgi:lipopolysaccharide transport system ATP-binding protein
MPEMVIAVEGLSKQYRYGVIGHGTLYKDIESWWARVRGKEDPNVKITSDVGLGLDGEWFWALQDVSFEVQQGEVLGIIGRNGAGKSTLLKILSRVTIPTRGVVKIKGRVASLLEIGTGFHPELTGRDNIYLNGAILGMTKAEIKSKFDEIVDFSGLERFIDTPVKRYSSGMHVRLAFAVAAHLEPEILFVDEVLAVGDAEFQKKCLGKMEDIAKGGRTILFVSHNMAAIRNLCGRALLIDKGRLVLDDAAGNTVTRYLNQGLIEGVAVISAKEFEADIQGKINKGSPSIRLKEVGLFRESGSPCNSFFSDEGVKVSVTYQCLDVVTDLRVIVRFVDEEDRTILTVQNCDDPNEFDFYRREIGLYKSSCVIPPNTFGSKRFYVSVALINPKTEHLSLRRALEFDIKFKGYNNVQYGSCEDSFVRPQLKWETEVPS